ncbi:MAG: DUF4832 domain-containing protein [Saprospiraceae bacterium]
MLKSIALYLVMCILVSNSAAAQVYRASFTEDPTLRANPERGFSRWTRSEPNDLYPFQASWLDPLRADLKQTVIKRTYYFTDAYDSPIPQPFLDHITSDLQAVRAAGMKLAIRFAYTYEYGNTDGAGNAIPPYLDGPTDPELIFQHIEQLKPVLADNWDIILTMHNGFWGTWGENYYSDAFGSEANPPVTNAQWDLRKRLIDTLLSWIPEDRFLSQRYPQLKEQFYNLDIPADSITASTAYTSLPQARIGYHNDCFLVAANDYTYSDTTTQKPFVETEAKYTLMGGETCGNSSFADCGNALKELERFHWTYLNDNYHPDVLSRWEQEGCYDEIASRLGYRIVLDSLEWDIASPPQPEEPFTLKLYLRNIGFAAPIHDRPVQLVFEYGTREAIFTNPSTDIRTWQPGHVEWSLTGVLPSNYSFGEFYNLYLSLPDVSLSLQSNPRYAVALASKDDFNGRPLFDENDGRNLLLELGFIISTKTELEHSIALPQNPVRDQLSIRSTSAEELQVRLLSLTGKTLLTGSFKGDGDWNVSHLPTGVYALHVQNEQGDAASWKVVKVE